MNWIVDERIEARGFTSSVCHSNWSKTTEILDTSDQHVLTLGLSAMAEIRQCFIPHPAASKYTNFGKLFLLPAGVPYRSINSAGNYKFLRVQIAPELLNTITKSKFQWDLETALDLANPYVDSLLLRVVQETMNVGFAGHVLIEGLMSAVMVDLCRDLKQAKANSPTLGKLSRQQVRVITDYLESVEGPPPSIAELAQRVGVSRGHLMRVFKSSTGQTLYDVITQIKVRKAISLLCATDMQLKEISHRLGFESRSGFAMAFRKATGQSPRAYRQTFQTGRVQLAHAC